MDFLANMLNFPFQLSEEFAFECLLVEWMFSRNIGFLLRFQVFRLAFRDACSVFSVKVTVSLPI
jgi:hypothetical protein